MIDRTYIGRVLPSHTVEVEKGRLRFFAKVIGETNPIYTDEAAARDAGYASLPAPPTFAFTLEQEVPDYLGQLEEMGVDLRKILHGEQTFTYHAPICAGDTLTFEPRIADIFDKKNGALEFIVREVSVKNQTGALVAELRSVVVVRHG